MFLNVIILIVISNVSFSQDYKWQFVKKISEDSVVTNIYYDTKSLVYDNNNRIFITERKEYIPYKLVPMGLNVKQEIQELIIDCKIRKFEPLKIIYTTKDDLPLTIDLGGIPITEVKESDFSLDIILLEDIKILYTGLCK